MNSCVLTSASNCNTISFTHVRLNYIPYIRMYILGSCLLSAYRHSETMYGFNKNLGQRAGSVSARIQGCENSAYEYTGTHRSTVARPNARSISTGRDGVCSTSRAPDASEGDPWVQKYWFWSLCLPTMATSTEGEGLPEEIPRTCVIYDKYIDCGGFHSDMSRTRPEASLASFSISSVEGRFPQQTNPSLELELAY